MERDELKKFLKLKLKNYNIKSVVSHLKNSCPVEYSEIIEQTKYLKPVRFTERIYNIINDLYSIPKCECGNDLKFKDLKSGYRNFCSVKCSASSNKTVNKRKSTTLNRYGNENFNNREKFSKSYNEDRKNRMLNTKSKTNIERYGNPFYTNREKSARTKRLNFFKNILFDKLDGVAVPLFTIDEYDGVKNKLYKFKCVKCGNIFMGSIDDGKLPRCLKCNPILSGTSKMERELQAWVREILANG